MPTDHSAKPQSLGYHYQIRLALYLILTGDEGASLLIEGLDDIEIQQGGDSSELLQLKHHQQPTTISDLSTTFWKSLLIWIETIESERVDPTRTRLSLITTATLGGDTALSLLSSEASRDEIKAIERLDRVASSSKNKTLKPIFEKYLSLPQKEKERIFKAITIIPASSTITEVKRKILREIIRYSAKPENAESLYSRLEGWWFDKAVLILSGEGPTAVTAKEVTYKLLDLSSQFKPTSLPIDYLTSDPPDAPNPETDQRLFVLQLREIKIIARRIEFAIIDYYRAFEQRSRWTREDLIFSEELEKYESKLIEEWERFQLLVLQKWQGKSKSEADLQAIGQEIYEWVEHVAEFPIREEVKEPFIWRGSYHMLASERPPKVWWHPEFLSRLGTILTETTGIND